MENGYFFSKIFSQGWKMAKITPEIQNSMPLTWSRWKIPGLKKNPHRKMAIFHAWDLKIFSWALYLYPNYWHYLMYFFSSKRDNKSQHDVFCDTWWRARHFFFNRHICVDAQEDNIGYLEKKGRVFDNFGLCSTPLHQRPTKLVI